MFECLDCRGAALSAAEVVHHVCPERKPAPWMGHHVNLPKPAKDCTCVHCTRRRKTRAK